jgi:hypothetical protein
MDASATAKQLIEQLDADQLEARLDQIDGERRAVLVLLRAARSRHRRQHNQRFVGETPQVEGGARG